MRAWFTLFRAGNLLMAFCVYALSAWIVSCAIRPFGYWVQHAWQSGVLLLAMAIGNLHNDFIDIEADKINHSDRPLAAGTIDVKWAQQVGYVAIISGLFWILSAYIWANPRLQPLWLGGWFVAAVLLLWCYNTILQGVVLWGNLSVALLSAGVPLLAGRAVMWPSLPDPMHVFAWKILVLFAFLGTFWRELIKDLQDYEGDKAVGCNTMPVRLGQKAARTFLVCYTILLLLVMGYLSGIAWQSDDLLHLFLGMFLLGMGLFVAWLLSHLRFAEASKWSKIWMLVGMAYVWSLAVM